MVRCRQSQPRWGICVTAGVAIAWVVSHWTTPTFAQVIPDSTLGVEQSVVTPDVIIQGIPTDQIDGGAIRGTNLFHSFSEFNVGEGQRVYFANPTGIDNILSRVTGRDVSDILGTLGVNGGANLFLMNPNGIVFGKNAQLDVQGAFVASTAQRWVFENGTEFSATNPQAPPLLTINLTPGLQYGSNHQGAIASSGGLAVGGDLILAGRNLDLENQVQAGGDLTLLATDTVKVRDSITNPFIASAMGQLLVQGNQSVDIFALNHPDSGLFSGEDMVLRSVNTVSADAHFWSGGNFRIEQLDSSLGNLSSPDDPVIRASGDVSFQGYRGGSLHILAGGQVEVEGGIIITGADAINGLSENVILSDGTSVPINGQTQPTVDIRAGTTAFGIPGIIGNGSFEPAPPETNTSPTGSDIRIRGGIDINAEDGIVLLTNQYQPNPSLSGGVINVGVILTNDTVQFSGNSGSVFIDSRGAIEVGRIDTSSGSGNGGSITILSDQSITFTGDVDSSVRSVSGVGGDIRITAQDQVSLINANTLIRSNTTGQGKGGDIDINARSLSLSNGAGIFTVTQSEGEEAGQGGNLTINATESVELIGVGQRENSDDYVGSNLQARTLGDGDAGDLTVNTRQLILRDGGEISTANCGNGAVSRCGRAQSGTLRVNASEFIELSGTPDIENPRPSGFYSQSLLDGDGGDIFIETRRLIIRDGAQIAAAAEDTSSGSSGNITVTASDSVELFGTRPDGTAGGVYTFTLSSGEGGKLTINTRQFRAQDGASVATSTNGTGNAGDLEINASESMELINAEVRARTTLDVIDAGDAGNLSINTNQLTVRDGGLVTASTFGSGEAGTLTVNADDFVQVIGTSANGQTSSRLFLDSTGSGNAGGLEINTGTLIVQEGGRVSATTSDQGQAGNLMVNADSVQVIGTSANGESSSLLFDTSGSGDAGILDINTNRLVVRDGARVSAVTSSIGEAGKLNVTATESVEVIGTSADGTTPSRLLFDSSASGTGGNAGELTIDTSRLIVKDGGLVSATTANSGEAGKLAVNASESVEVIGTASDGITPSRLLFDSLATETGGNAGELTIDTSRLIVKDGGLVSATTANTGEAGKLAVNASESVEISGASANGQTPSRLVFDSSGSGNAGELKIDTERLVIQGGGQVSATTFDSGEGGIIDVNASESVEVRGTGSGLYFESQSLANARGITLNTGRLTVENGGQLTVSGSGSGTSGDLEITADSIFLINQGRLRATTTASEGGNIRLDVADSIIMRFNSEIAAEAFGTANGGNITINAGGIVFAILSENSDVVANAFAGQGGTISATALLIEGFRQFEDRRTSESDFTASSELGIDGTEEINTETRPQPEPLPQLQSVDPIEPRCQVGQRRGSNEFIISGRGGLPPNPINNGSYNQGWVDFRDPISSTENRVNSGGNNPQTATKSTQIIEAQGWIIKENGEVELVATAPNPTLYSSWQTPICPAPNEAIVP
ncbi:MAG: filamentous hemagglutinin N-terminal domain-containing protein [Coleofasciculus sp. G1-WW12-02]|uniref:two-partner secretion domain-containing protein n=1 Tax=Coleofasciculus sp. G1-WW12-02 TaxID=3068483 RepID=UPI0032FBC546